MMNEEAIKQLKITRECDVDTVAQIKALDVAINALSNRPTGDPLTLEQLRELNGQPVWVEFEDGSGGLWGIVHVSVFEQIVFPNGLHCTIGHPYYGKIYKAYAYPPAHIDREEWKPCWLCSISSGEPAKHLILPETCNGEAKYCPECGRPITPEAWAELEKRLRE